MQITEEPDNPAPLLSVRARQLLVVRRDRSPPMTIVVDPSSIFDFHADATVGYVHAKSTIGNAVWRNP